MLENLSGPKVINNEILIEPPNEGEVVSLDQIIASTAKDVSIRLIGGKYLINETIRLTRSIRLIGSGIDNTVITSCELSHLLESDSDNVVDLEGISFVTTNKKSATPVIINGGVLKVRACSFSGGKGEADGKFGTGLYVGECREIEILQSRFENNQESGLWIDGNASGSVAKNEFKGNDSGLAVTGDASTDALENYFTQNHVSIVYDHSSTGHIKENIFTGNRSGALIKGKSTVSLLNNKFSKNDLGIGLAENCDVRIEENEIEGGQYGFKLIQEAKAIINKNQIRNNETGIYCIDHSIADILNNLITHNNGFGICVDDESTTHIDRNTINENEAAIRLQGSSNSIIENNQVIGNSLYGILAKSNSRGFIHKNLVKKHPHWNVRVIDEADMDFDNYKEPLPPGKPVGSSLVENQILISAPDSNERVYFTELFNRINPGQEIVLESGEYTLSDPMIIDKPVKLIAKTPGDVCITSDELINLLTYEGDGELILTGIQFSLINPVQTNVIVIKSGELEMDQCIVEGGKDPNGSKRDFGAGLIFLGGSSAKVINSEFKKNLLGISVQDTASVTLEKNLYTENVYGIVFRDKSMGHLCENEYSSNGAYGHMAYDASELSVSGDTSHNNQGGFGYINNCKANVVNSESFENKYHGIFIDNEADCTLQKNLVYANGMSGIAAFGISNTLMEENEVYGNRQAGFEMAENARSTLINNKIFENSVGIYLGNRAINTIDKNEIYGNEIGIRINDEATATIENNKIYQNSEEAIDDSSENESTIGDNEIYDNGEGKESDEDGNDSVGFSLGDFFAQLLGGENLSDDPNAAIIPISDEMPESGKANEDASEGESEDSQAVKEEDNDDETEEGDEVPPHENEFMNFNYEFFNCLGRSDD